MTLDDVGGELALWDAVLALLLESPARRINRPPIGPAIGHEESARWYAKLRYASCWHRADLLRP